MGEHRKKWDRQEFEKIASNRLQDESKADTKSKQGQKRELLKTRDYKVDLTSKLGKTTIINKNATTQETGGYYCNVCDCLVKDSINFLDHINGKKHQRNNGMSMKISRSTIEDVRERFAMHKKKMEQKKKEYDLSSRLEQIAQEEEKLKEYRREKRREGKRKRNDVEEPAGIVGDGDGDGNGDGDDMSALMGFSGFSTTKKKC